MADQIQVPGPISPPQGQPVAPPWDMVNAQLNRTQQNVQAIPNAINEAVDAYYKKKQLQAAAFEAGGPALMQQLYGGGSAPQPPIDNNSQPQPMMHPTSGLPQTIHDHLTSQGIPEDQHTQALSGIVQAGNPNMGVHAQKIQQLQAQMAQNAQMGTYGANLNKGLQDQLGAERALMEGEQFNIGQQRQQDQFNQSQNAEEDRFQRGQTLKKNEATAGAVSKEGETVSNLKTIDSAIDQISSALKQNKPSPVANIMGDIAERAGTSKPFGIPIGSDSAKNVNEASANLRAALSTEITKSGRYTPFVDRLLDVMVPTAKDQDWQKKLQNIKTFRNAIATGAQQNVDNAVDSLLGGKVSIPTVQANEPPVAQGRVTVKSPDGRIGHIPASQLKAALAQGYTQQ